LRTFLLGGLGLSLRLEFNSESIRAESTAYHGCYIRCQRIGFRNGGRRNRTHQRTPAVSIAPKASPVPHPGSALLDVPPAGFEPASRAYESSALSIELRGLDEAVQRGRGAYAPLALAGHGVAGPALSVKGSAGSVALPHRHQGPSHLGVRRVGQHGPTICPAPRTKKTPRGRLRKASIDRAKAAGAKQQEGPINRRGHLQVQCIGEVVAGSASLGGGCQSLGVNRSCDHLTDRHGQSDPLDVANPPVTRRGVRLEHSQTRWTGLAATEGSRVIPPQNAEKSPLFRHERRRNPADLPVRELDVDVRGVVALDLEVELVGVVAVPRTPCRRSSFRRSLALGRVVRRRLDHACTCREYTLPVPAHTSQDPARLPREPNAESRPRQGGPGAGEPSSWGESTPFRVEPQAPFAVVRQLTP